MNWLAEVQFDDMVSTFYRVIEEFITYGDFDRDSVSFSSWAINLFDLIETFPSDSIEKL